MAVYKVPQDVEAEDKLIGPFSFRQFIYLIIAALGIFLAWALSQIFIGLLVLPLPIIVAMLALALPLRKDQPMETYLIAMLKFFFKPRNRMWDPEGNMTLVQITAPKVQEGPQTKDFSGDEASQRLAYLAQVVDTQGWSTRGVANGNDNMIEALAADASHAEDVMDDDSTIAQAFTQKMAQADDARKQAVMQQVQDTPAPQSTTVATDDADDTPPQDVHYNPYPKSIHQKVISPSGTPKKQPQADKPAPEPSETTVSPDILRLANNNDLSISALSREAHRLEDDDQEVVISLR